MRKRELPNAATTIRLEAALVLPPPYFHFYTISNTYRIIWTNSLIIDFQLLEGELGVMVWSTYYYRDICRPNLHGHDDVVEVEVEVEVEGEEE